MSKTVLNDIKLFDQEKPKILSPHPLFDNFGEIVAREKALDKLNLDSSFRYILFFGLIRKYKGLDLLIEAFAHEKLRDKNLKLIIAGEYYSDKKTYTDLIKKYDLEDHIIQVDKFIADSMVKYYFCASDVVVQPYKSATQSGVTQIAYHFNKPMIVTDVGGLSELCPHEKVGYVVPIDAEKIAYAMLRFFDKTDQEKMINNIKEEKKKYSWGLLVDNILGMFQQI
jgi:glycosyltransferase involved in cell wall biosynthesis